MIELRPVLRGEGHVGENVRLGLVHQGGELGDLGFIISSVIGGLSIRGWSLQLDPTRRPPMAPPTTLLDCYSAVEGAQPGIIATAELHHLSGHYPSADGDLARLASF